MGHNFKKKFGQNFLRGTKFVDKLLEPLGLVEGDVVLEIGPGDGIVTKKILATGAKVICIEIDYDLIVKLIQRFGANENFKIVHKDILDVDIIEVLRENNVTEIKIAGSLPYNISKKIIDKIFRFNLENADKKVRVMSFIVQDEVAKDYVAKAPKASFLSNYAKIFSEVKKLESIPASAFIPKPKVNGGILLFKLRDKIPPYHKELSKLIRTGFSSPRKKVISNLGNVFDKKRIQEIFKELNLGENSRAADLEFEDWVAIYDLFS